MFDWVYDNRYDLPTAAPTYARQSRQHHHPGLHERLRDEGAVPILTTQRKRL